MNEEMHLGATWCSVVLEGAQAPRSAHLCALMLSSTRSSSLTEEMMMMITKQIILVRGAPAPPPAEVQQQLRGPSVCGAGAAALWCSSSTHARLARP